MKINKLTINELRGIRELELNPHSKTVLIQGENGTGKSGVIDAIDFLFTGFISRISGAGTQGITLDKHGKHISCKDKDKCWVEASVQLGDGSLATIRRQLNDPEQLIVDNETPELLKALEIAGNGKFCLSRREILKFIAATAGQRGQQIQELLKLEDVEDARKSIGKQKRDTAQHVKSAETSYARAIEAYKQTVANEKQSDSTALDIVNKYRKELGGTPIAELSVELILSGITQPSVDAQKGIVNKGQMLNACESLKGATDLESILRLISDEGTLGKLVSGIVSEPSNYKAYKEMRLVQDGLDLVDQNTDSCPLCDTGWDADSLINHLNTKLNIAKNVGSTLDEVSSVSKNILGVLNGLTANIGIIEDGYKKLDKPHISDLLTKLKGTLETIIDKIESPFDEQHRESLSTQLSQKLIDGFDLSGLFASEEEYIQNNIPDLNESIAYWTFLNTLKGAIERGRQEKIELAMAKSKLEKSKGLEKAFLAARDSILQDLYDSISNRFEFLYKQIHNEDENGFRAKITQKTAGLDIGVDFYGKGLHPPQAMHSDGHQDSMGLCLYLALYEQMHGDKVQFVALDDVVISIDYAHRRKIAELLADQFPETQFFITTHEAGWSNQLSATFGNTLGEFVQFFDWNVETGPTTSNQVNFIDKAKDKLTDNDIHGAAHTLRRGLEEFFARACESLQAKVTYRHSAAWELNEKIDAAISKLKKTFKEAIKSSKSWGKDSSALEDLQSKFTSADAHRREETWALNPIVHFNDWLQMTNNDFLPIIIAYEEFCSFFTCPNCNAILRYSSNDCVKCGCPQTHWTLNLKK